MLPLKKQNKAVDFATALSDVMDFESASSATVPSSHYNIKSPTLGKAVLCMVAGHLRVQNGYWQMILSYRDSTGKRRTKSVSTHLKEKGNKRRAEAMLLDLRRAFTKERQHDLQNGWGNPKFCVTAKTGANREKFIMGGRREKRLPPC